jgi:hypothetical protein
MAERRIDAGDNESIARVNCIHAVVMPLWGNEEDRGIKERVSSYRCEGCGRELTVDQGKDAIRRGTVVLGT